MKEYYRRYLPHIQPPEGTFFVTTHLDGSLPKEALLRIKAEHETAIRRIKDSKEKFETKQEQLINEHKKYFGKYDKLLDDASVGPKWLAEPEVAKVVADSLHFYDNSKYTLICYCIMPNHIHLIIKLLHPKLQLFKVLQSVKQWSARKSNELLDRNGQFWQHESYDHLVRDDQELLRITNYVLLNPTKVGLVKNWEEWKFIYVRQEYIELLSI